MKTATTKEQRALNKVVRYCVSIAIKGEAGETEIKGALLPAVVKYAKARGSILSEGKLSEMVDRLTNQVLEQSSEAVS